MNFIRNLLCCFVLRDALPEVPDVTNEQDDFDCSICQESFDRSYENLRKLCCDVS